MRMLAQNICDCYQDSIMLNKIHKFANATSRPIAICGTQKHTHTQKDKWGRATKDGAQNVESTKNALVAQR